MRLYIMHSEVPRLRCWKIRHYAKNFQEHFRAVKSFNDDVRLGFLKVNTPDKALINSPNVRAIYDDLGENCFTIPPVLCRTTSEPFGIRLCVLLAISKDIVQVFQQYHVVPIAIENAFVPRCAVFLSAFLEV